MVRSVIVVFVIFVVIHSQLTKKTSSKATTPRCRSCQPLAIIQTAAYIFRVSIKVYEYKTEVLESVKKVLLVTISLIRVILVMMGWDILIVRIIL